jgi:GTPase SAR1 family protein
MSTAHRGDADSEEDDDLERKSLTYSQVFSGVQIGEKPIRILVEGGAGTGKTALCMLLFKGWENSELFQNIELLLLLSLHQAKVKKARSVSQLIKTLFPSHNCDIISYLEQTKGEKVLIIADGFSELAETEFQRGSFLHNLLLGGLLNQASVLITSRPSASASLHKTPCNIDYFMELYGFSGSTIRQYIREKFTGDQQKAIGLLEQLEGNSLIQEVCRIPLNCAVVCFLWQDNQELLFSTSTGFLTEIILNFVYRNMLKNDAYSSHPRLLNIHSLPESLHNPWGVVCEIAFQTIRFSPGINPQIELAAVALSQPGLETLGVLDFINKVSFRFVHPSFQEFFAALYLTMLPLDRQLKIFELHTKSKHLTLFYRLFFGLYFQNYSNNIVSVAGISQIMRVLSQSYAANNDGYLLCHYAFEAKNSDVTKGIIGALSNRIESYITMSFGHPPTALDCRAIMYIIANIQEITVVEIDFHDCHLGDRWMCDIVVSVLSKKATIVYVKILNLINNNLTDNGIVDLFSEETSSAFRYLAKLFLRDNRIGERSICAIKATLAKSSCSMNLLDLSNNPLSIGGIKELQSAVESNSLKKLEILFLRGTLPTDNTNSNVTCLNAFAIAISTHCPRLRRLDLSAIDLGEPGDKAICNLVLHFTGTKTNFDLQLNREYIPEVDKKFMAVMEDCIKKKGTIDHTVVHGIIVGPGRSGKDSLMNRLLGNAPQNKIYLSASTGVLESVVKVEVKKLCCTTGANNLKWRRLEYNEEGLELMMSTAKHCSVAHDRKTQNLSQSKVVDSCKFSQTDESCDKPPECNEGKLIHSNSLRVKSNAHCLDEYLCEDSMLHHQANQVLVVPVQDKWPGVTDVLKSAVESRRMDDLREHLESSWSLYLTNTGGQMEFQELLPLLVCGPSAFFVTFPLNKDLMEHYTVLYHHNDADRTEETYQSPSTLMDEILQTLATINALDLTGHRQDNQLKPIVFLIGTHKDKLPDHLVEERIQEIDQQIQEKIKQMSLFCQDSIEFAELQGKKRLIFTVNNLAEDDTDFQKIRCALQRATEKTDQFTIKCPSTWLIFSLALREKHKSSQILTYDECFTVAQGCGISDREELNKALFFIHTKLGLVRYFNVKELNKRVIIDPQILFDKITDLIVKTFVFDNADVNEVEKFQNQGIFSVKTMERICRKRHRSESQLPFKWLLELLSHLRIAAVFKDKDGTLKCFFPAVLCHAPAQQQIPLKDSDSPQHDSLLVAFESGFCPRGIPSALITYLITNEMDSEFSWELLPFQIFKNQVCFSIEGCGDIILRIHTTHLQLCLDPEAEISDENELKLTVGEVYKCIGKGMKTVAKGYKNCNYYFAFHCTMHDCKKSVHPAKIIWRDDRPVKVKCMVTYKQYSLPDHGVWDLRRVNYTEIQGILSIL